MKTTISSSFLTLGAAFAAICLLPLTVPAQTNSAPATTTTTDGPEARLMQSLKIPSKLDEIAQLSKAGVGDPVILAYIKDSQTAYNLNAQDIIKLRDQGVSPEVTAALIQRGTEVRQATQESAKESQTTEVAAAPTYQSQPVAAQPAQTTVYVVEPPRSTVSVHYFGTPSYRYAPTYYYPRHVSYPSYVSFGSRYGYAPRASFRVGFGGHYGGHRGGGFHSSARYCR